MGIPVDFKGTNLTLTPPILEDGTVDDRVQSLSAFTNGVAVVTAWQFTPEEIEQINRDGCVYLSVLVPPDHFPPIFLGSSSSVRDAVQDMGGSWG